MKSGNHKTVFSTIGATNHSGGERANHDYYATDPAAATLLMQEENLSGVWECACGDGALAKVFDKSGVLKRATDLIDRGYGQGGIDFLQEQGTYDGDIVTNPPYKHAEDFIRKAYGIIPDGRKVCMFLKLTFLESKARKKMFAEIPLKTLYVSSSRIGCYKNNNKENPVKAIAYGWYVWEKGYKGDPTIKWIN